MNFFLLLSFFVLFLSIFIARIITEKATQALSDEKKLALIDLFSKKRIYSLGIILGVFALYILVQMIDGIDGVLANIIYFSFLILYMFISGYLNYRKLKSNDFPSAYIKSYLFALVVRFVGMAVFVLYLENMI